MLPSRTNSLSFSEVVDFILDCPACLDFPPVVPGSRVIPPASFFLWKAGKDSEGGGGGGGSSDTYPAIDVIPDFRDFDIEGAPVAATAGTFVLVDPAFNDDPSISE